MLSRRQYLHGLWSSLLAFHTTTSIADNRKLEMTGPPEPDPPSVPTDDRPSLAQPAGVELRQLQLACSQLKPTETFYRDRLGLPVTRTTDNTVTVTVGRSTIRFYQAARNVQPFYHFAFNISRNKFDLAKRWIAERTPIVVSPDGRDQFHFTSRDADAVYFLDPSGNLVEFIAHARLPNQRAGGFSKDDIHEVCEIGMVTPHFAASLQQLKQDLNVEPYLPPSSNEFAAVGDERGFLIVVKQDRLWFPRRVRKAAPFPTGITLTGTKSKTIALDDSQVTINVVDDRSPDGSDPLANVKT